MKHILILIAISIVLCSCDSETVVFSEATPLADEDWEIGEKVDFSLALQDTSSALDVYLTLDNTEDYPYRNIYLFVNMKFPNDKWLRDTVEFYMADGMGKWVGASSSGGYRNEVLYKYRRKMPLPGDYQISVEHGMRDQQLEGVREVGIKIIKAKR